MKFFLLFTASSSIFLDQCNPFIFSFSMISTFYLTQWFVYDRRNQWLYLLYLMHLQKFYFTDQAFKNFIGIFISI